MKINKQVITAKEFAWDKCHKMYLIDTPYDKKIYTELGYTLFPIAQLKKAYTESCDLRFISHGDLDLPNVVNQFEKAIFNT